ncbi:CHASE2 domain-containing protein [Uliginosibacterium sp. 31-12]|uniref:CHASE2 domain-containing protein n=1 Tax=Uliginosibacterium sp. 31-12 TaxID=3062781 RepID=UPI0026E45C04|nr:CHASE2 domain-containing protein [Uliginosibacterium sp. 31-12]MDO6387203.1 CHASE2 and HATPase_c domain-containing protein [Uliginosibacterium sp. 31-12]
MQPAQRIRLEWALVSGVLALLALACALQGWLWRFDLQLHDIALSRAEHPADQQIVIVAIDDASLAELGRWPWPRSLHATLVDRLSAAGATAVALDIIFSEAAAEDVQLAAALRRHARVVLPVLQLEQDELIVGENLPAPALRAAAAALGHIQMEFDPDGLARSVYLQEGWQRAAHPQLALALDRLARGEAQPAPLNPGPGWRRSGWLRIPFAGPPGSFARVSYADVIAGRVPAERLRDKLVLVGATAPGLTDSVPVPGSGFSRPMPGVEVHANVLAALRAGSGIALMPPWLNAAFALCVSLGLMLGLRRSSARSGLLWTLAMLLGVLLASWLGLRHLGFWLAPGAALLICLLAYPLWSWRRLEATQRYMDGELQALQRDSLLPPPESGPDPFQQRLTLLRSAAALGREAHALVEAVIAHLPVGVIALHGDGSLRLANPAAYSLLDLPAGADLTMALRQLRWPASLQPQAGLPARPAEPLEAELQSGAGRPLLLRLAALGEGWVLGLADLSHVEEARQAREDTLRFVTHDLRAPLASIISLIDTPPDNFEPLPAIRGISERALNLIDELFRLSRAEAVSEGSFELTDLQTVIVDACELCWSQARAARVTFQVDAGGDAEALVRGHHELLYRAVANLLSNAIKYGGPERTVEISLRAEGAHWLLAVRDHGPGIPEAQRGRLFERFARLPDAVRRGLPGSGLGLLMVRTVATRHGGRVSAEFPADGGCRFILELPQTHQDLP